jgi:hypothetical protein
MAENTPTPELETAEAFLIAMRDIVLKAQDVQFFPFRELKTKALALIEADRAAVALRSKRELLEEIRTAANEFLVGKGLTISPCEAIGDAVQDAAIKYAQEETT